MDSWGRSEGEGLSLTLDSEGQEVKRGGGGLRSLIERRESSNIDIVNE